MNHGRDNTCLMLTRQTQLLAALVTVLALPSFAQTWTQTSAPLTGWHSIASSADGTTLVALGYPGLVYTSTNSGGTWNATSAPNQFWTAVACSADGATMVAASAPPNGPGAAIFISRDAGANWTQATAPDYYWTSVTSSADGTRFVAVSGGDPRFFTDVIYVSLDSGATWTAGSAPNQWWSSVASAADGLRLAVTSTGGTYTSTNGGFNWTPTPSASPGLYVGVSAEANKLLVLTHGSISVSSDWGVTWTSAPAPDSVGLGGPRVSCSADGASLFSVGSGIFEVNAFASTNSGVGWLQSTVSPWGSTNAYALASSADGCKLAVAIDVYGIFTSQTTPAPILTIRPSGSNLLLSWVVPSRNFILQESGDLAAWSAVGVTPVLNYANLRYEVSFSRPVGPKFYRLAAP